MKPNLITFNVCESRAADAFKKEMKWRNSDNTKKCCLKCKRCLVATDGTGLRCYGRTPEETTALNGVVTFTTYSKMTCDMFKGSRK